MDDPEHAEHAPATADAALVTGGAAGGCGWRREPPFRTEPLPE